MVTKFDEVVGFSSLSVVLVASKLIIRYYCSVGSLRGLYSEGRGLIFGSIRYIFFLVDFRPYVLLTFLISINFGIKFAFD